MRVKYALSLIRAFTISDLKVKYNSSILGYFWSLLNPILMLATLIIAGSVTNNELYSGLLSIAILVPYYITLYIFRHLLKKVFNFEVEEIN